MALANLKKVSLQNKNKIKNKKDLFNGKYSCCRSFRRLILGTLTDDSSCVIGPAMQTRLDDSRLVVYTHDVYATQGMDT